MTAKSDVLGSNTRMIDLETVGIGLGLIVAGIWNGWQTVQSKREAKAARREASKAAEHAYPISNGWGTQLRDDLAAVRRTSDRIAEAQLVAERRELARDDLLHDLADRLAGHIEHHPKAAA